MNSLKIMQELKKAGIPLEPGMTTEELDLAEEAFGFRFPKEIREFLSCCVPVGKGFFDYRDVSEQNRKVFQDFQNQLEKDFRFDLADNREELLELLDTRLGNPADFDAAVLQYFHESVKLIPFFIHRCFFDGMDGMPIVSFWQPTDVIFYGNDFREYLEIEFLGKKSVCRKLPENFPKETGIWYELLIN